ncbi:hypothetical protein CH330_06795 [candidate division WOR-3 bacterium JGI_Cruoil_03_51_56]|uniref:DUF5683 domain-containing protein n=1 Tax=candidate division WOR-3 bacterium JGI_Cruoil_03_51_56 TaxID=1973747 RepID=A0A235BS67_UNCW3|nr:MAG: hypothetical protein CH330_06795 [candidate division WOR-3 bacterium JGI_Cruoil_03_51_56]
MNLNILLLLVISTVARPELGDSLFNCGLYAAAATEYKRALFDKETAYLQLKTGLSLGAADELEKAADALHRAGELYPHISYESGLALSGMFAQKGQIDRARLELLDLLIFTRDSVRKAELNSDIAWLELASNDLAQAGSAYDKAGRADISTEIYRIERLHRKNPTIAAILSSFIPGAGEIYAGRYQTGLLSILATGGSAAGVYYAAHSDNWVTATVLFSVLFLRFYNGSRQNAVDFTNDFNLAQQHQRLYQLMSNKNLKPDWFSPARKLTGLNFPQTAFPSGLWEKADRPVLLPSPHE